MPTQDPFPQEFPNLVVNPREAGFCNNVPMVRGPTPNDGVECSDQVGLRRTYVGLHERTDRVKKGRNVLPSRCDQQLARVSSNIFTKEVKTRRDMRNLGFLLREFQSSFSQEFNDYRSDLLFQDCFRSRVTTKSSAYRTT
jgi:hypothetical protein